METKKAITPPKSKPTTGDRTGSREPKIDRLRIPIKGEDPIEDFRTLWKAIKIDISDAKGPNFARYYHNLLDVLEISLNMTPLSYTAEHVKLFSLEIVEYQGDVNFTHKAGLFLSALIDKAEETDFKIYTQHFPQPPHHLGFSNRKNVKIIGNVGNFLGREMESGTIEVSENAENLVGHFLHGGKIIVKGDAEDRIGDMMMDGEIIIEGNVGDDLGLLMKKGTILVKGNAGNGVGRAMEGGKIDIEGNAGEEVGDSMQGGEIDIRGKHKRLGDIREGTIYRSGRVIMGVWRDKD